MSVRRKERAGTRRSMTSATDEKTFGGTARQADSSGAGVLGEGAARGPEESLGGASGCEGAKIDELDREERAFAPGTLP